MNEEEFSREVAGRLERSGQTLSKESVLRALEEFKGQGWTRSQGDIQACLARMTELDEERASGPGADRLDPVLDPTVDLAAADAFEQLEAGAAALRVELFGDPTAPFQSLNEAGAWIRREKEKAAGRQIDQTQLSSLLQAAFKACRELGDYLEVAVDPTPSARTLSYLEEQSGPDGGFVIRREGVFYSDVSLWKLQSFVSSASRETGLPEADIVAFVLAWKQVSRRANVHWVELSFPPKALQTIITIPKRFPVWADMRKAYKVIREARVNRRLLDKTGSCLVRVIRQRGGLPAKGKMRFWKEVSEQVKKELALKRFTERAALRRYERFPLALREELMAPISEP